MSLRFESRLTEKGYRTVMQREALMRLRWLLPIAAFFIFSTLGRGEIGPAVLLGVMTVGTVIAIFGYASWAAGTPAHRTLYDPVTYEVRGSGLAFETETGAGIVEWSQVRRWAYVKDHFLLYVGSSNYVLVPADALCNAGERIEFERILRENVAHGPRGAAAGA